MIQEIKKCIILTVFPLLNFSMLRNTLNFMSVQYQLRPYKKTHCYLLLPHICNYTYLLLSKIWCGKNANITRYHKYLLLINVVLPTQKSMTGEKRQYRCIEQRVFEYSLESGLEKTPISQGLATLLQIC